MVINVFFNIRETQGIAFLSFFPFFFWEKPPSLRALVGRTVRGAEYFVLQCKSGVCVCVKFLV